MSKRKRKRFLFKLEFAGSSVLCITDPKNCPIYVRFFSLVLMEGEDVYKNLDKLYKAAFDEPERVRDIIKKIVPNFNPKGE